MLLLISQYADILSFWLLQIEFLVTVAIICVLIGTCGRAYTGVSWHSLFRRSQYGRDISFNRICINIISQVVHIYCIKIHICKYFYHHIWDIHMYFFIYDNLSISHFDIYHCRLLVTDMMQNRQQKLVTKMINVAWYATNSLQPKKNVTIIIKYVKVH